MSVRLVLSIGFPFNDMLLYLYLGEFPEEIRVLARGAGRYRFLIHAAVDSGGCQKDAAVRRTTGNRESR